MEGNKWLNLKPWPAHDLTPLGSGGQGHLLKPLIHDRFEINKAAFALSDISRGLLVERDQLFHIPRLHIIPKSNRFPKIMASLHRWSAVMGLEPMPEYIPA